MIKINNLTKYYGDKLLFKNINLDIFSGEKIGIVGSNGAGKSTFLKIIAGEVEPDSGAVKTTGKIAYAGQIAEEFDLNNISNDDFITFLKNKNKLNLNIEKLTEFGNLSGGEKTKLVLSLVLSQDVDILLLDEPTNNLDATGIDWLINEINKFGGTALIVSHDRSFLDKTVQKIIEFENGKLSVFDGNYSSYKNQKEFNLNSNKREYELKLIENKKIENQIKKLNNQAEKIQRSAKKADVKTRRLPGFKTSIEQKVSKIESQAKSKQTRLEKMQNTLGERPYEEGEIYYKLAADNLFGKMLINIKNVSKNYGQKIIFDNINLTINNGEKIALIGDNGSGKTTFIKMLLNETTYDGQIIKNKNIKFACLSQDAFNYESSLTIIELSREFGDLQTQFLTNLINMGFRREMFSKKISTLSSGEKMKLKLNELILGNFNFLILDEPTNNLDISNKVFLEKVLSNFKGTCLIVSHDRAFIDNICTCKIKIENKKLIEIN